MRLEVEDTVNISATINEGLYANHTERNLASDIEETTNHRFDPKTIPERYGDVQILTLGKQNKTPSPTFCAAATYKNVKTPTSKCSTANISAPTACATHANLQKPYAILPPETGRNVGWKRRLTVEQADLERSLLTLQGIE
jgi:hypothetical protein